LSSSTATAAIERMTLSPNDTTRKAMKYSVERSPKAHAPIVRARPPSHNTGLTNSNRRVGTARSPSVPYRQLKIVHTRRSRSRTSARPCIGTLGAFARR
jgi:hypothetical protein